MQTSNGAITAKLSPFMSKFFIPVNIKWLIKQNIKALIGFKEMF
jgi:hypothetical protein